VILYPDSGVNPAIRVVARSTWVAKIGNIYRFIRGELMKKISVLGTGMVGSAIVRDLEPDFDVLAVDQDESRLGQLQKHCRCRTLRADLSDAERVREICSRQDLVVGAVPGFMGFETLRAVIESGTDIVDISFFSQDSFELDHLAREHGVTAIVDCGIVPGLSNMFLGSHTAREEVVRYECLVGGLPFRRTQPFEYKAPFSPIDVIEEYLRPARMVVGGRIIEKPALSERDYIDFDPIGTLEAFNTDGLRTLLTTVEVPNMVEKTLRYPGHADQMLMLREMEAGRWRSRIHRNAADDRYSFRRNRNPTPVPDVRPKRQGKRGFIDGSNHGVYLYCDRARPGQGRLQSEGNHRSGIRGTESGSFHDYSVGVG